MAKLRIKMISGQDVSLELLQQMSDLRRSVMTMKPHIDLARDFEKFSTLCRASYRVVLFYDHHQQLAGMYLFILRRGRTKAGKRYLLVLFEYAFMRAQYRGNPALPRSVLMLMWQFLRQWRGDSVWCGGIGYPAGHMAIQKFLGNLVFQGESGLSLIQSTLLDLITHEFGGANWDAQAGHVVMPTVPPPIWQEKVKSDPFYLRYMALNPRWQEGFGLPGVARVQPLLLVARSLGKVAQRMRRHFR